ncbi:mannosyltransferase [Neodidymelliopsis sp. IMI 364377]|nr:mannosyltransferase [Neodidymelliopsis sp. IMI 364377]
MRLPLELLLLVSSTLAAPLTPRHATFPQLRGLTPLSRDRSTTDSRFKDKYFHESVYHPHYDGRFAAHVLPHKTRAFHMRLLLKTYMEAMERMGVRTWIVHGTLLGWWWNGHVFPWDSDLDVQVEEGGMRELGAWWNMTVHAFSARELGLALDGEEARGWETRDTPQFVQEPEGLADDVWKKVQDEGKKYLLEVNPNFVETSTADRQNVIDARWIDTSTGLFIDITTIHPVSTDSSAAKSEAKHQILMPEGEEEAFEQDPEEMYTKDTHLYTTSTLFPLRRSTFEGVTVSVPYAYETLLIEEYGPRALIETWFNSYGFDEETKEWVVAPEVANSDLPSSGKGRGDRDDAAGRFRKGSKSREKRRRY